MDTLSFQLSNYTIRYFDQSIQLLRKEFELCQYLYLHPNHVFSRDALLEAVWSDAYPTDRTVDDHIYRLRKKLQPLSNMVKIETIRGLGYQLTVLPRSEVKPIITDPTFLASSTELLHTYHLYGNGLAIKSLLDNPAFGIEPPQNLRIPLAFMSGEYHAIVNDSSISFHEKALFLLWIHLLIEGAPHTVHYFNQARKKNLFPSEQQLEVETLSTILFNLLSRNIKETSETIAYTETKIISPDQSFYPFFRLTKMMYAICNGNKQQTLAEKKLLEDFFQKRPYQREKGIFTVLKGIMEIIDGKKTDGLNHIQEGMDTLKRSHFNSHIGLSIAILTFYLEKECKDKHLLKQRDTYYEEFVKPYKVEVLREQLKSLFQTHL
ncbi:winged helix-turn-helix domain-containing protein [Alkalihalophilus lindianensis]|uniref:Winged helix-turn-helix domain-containing protein n=1 Tax=Alkalihalophilus lindianensis TaxID=1630542 RepID=A0ABU3X526_9BACI|nr:winged helix-turn-helix domain-containing protein [Alkalihalophilus lindianensis]MDV2683002.1 winged helix-turn-helix domain-containing protein [Alkalihalophilus lindianensis]